jgi:hypothetical protein
VRLTPQQQADLKSYIADVKRLTNETAKKERFVALISTLLPRSRAVMGFVEGAEHRTIRIVSGGSRRRGNIDALYGQCIIEFEYLLSKTGVHAEEQLVEYISGQQAEPGQAETGFLGIATDGIEWRVYRPSGAKAKGRVELRQIHAFKVGDENIDDFWLWLNSVLFREGQLQLTSQQFKLDFGFSSAVYHDAMERFAHAWARAAGASEVQLAFDTWQTYLAVTYGGLKVSNPGGLSLEKYAAEQELVGVFFRHSYLVCVSRFLVWAKLSKGVVEGSFKTLAEDVLSGSYFESQRIANMVEGDFFQWVTRNAVASELTGLWESVVALLGQYDLQVIGEDVLKTVYEDLVDPKDRHDLGEYYTPDWLCERVVNEMIPGDRVLSVLDPSCGSGSFLRATISKYRSAKTLKGADLADAIVSNVAGIDVNPLAVTISRATYVLAMGDLVGALPRSVRIPVYLADALFLPKEVKPTDPDLFGQKQTKAGVQVTFGEKSVVFPHSLVNDSELFDNAISESTRVAAEHAVGKSETAKSLKAYLNRSVTKLGTLEDSDHVFEALWQYCEALAELIRMGKNSIWAFIIRNAYRPAMLRQKFDLILGNPPWLSLRYVDEPAYQAEIKQRAITEYGIAPTKQSLLTNMELGIVFFAHCISVFGNSEGRIAFVLPRSVLSADQHEKLRLRTYSAPFKLTGFWDLMEVAPLFRVPSCVLFGEASKVRGSSSDALKAISFKGKLPVREVAWEKAKENLKETVGTGRTIFLGKRNALSMAAGSLKAGIKSDYAARFTQGATIVPRNLFFVEISGVGKRFNRDSVYWAVTEPEQAKLAKAPYKGVALKGKVEGRFVYCSALSRNVLPFVAFDLPTVVLPVVVSGGRFEMKTAKELKAQGFRDFADWMGKAEKIWDEKRGKKGDKQSIYDRLDYQHTLTGQNPKASWLVLYNAAGTDVSAAVVEPHELDYLLVVEHKLYLMEAESAEEAHYLTAILNSVSINQLIKPFQTMGLLGPRDIEKKVLDAPIPHFDKSKVDHRTLADLGRRAGEKAKALANGAERGATLAIERKAIRKAVADELSKINELVLKIMI